jgi:hypothetical protein
MKLEPKLVFIELPELTSDLHKSYFAFVIADSLALGEVPIARQSLVSLFESEDLINKATLASWSYLKHTSKLVCYVNFGLSPLMLEAIYQATKLEIPVEYRRLKPEQCNDNQELFELLLEIQESQRLDCA